MITEIVPRLYSIYFLEKGKVEVDPYYAQASVFAFNDDICYLYGQLSQKPLTRAFYVNAFKNLKEKGFKKAIYYAPSKRRSLGGTPIEELPNFYCIDLE